MKAVRIHEYGDRSVLRYEEAEVPAPVTGEMLVRVHYAAVNPADCQFRSGLYREIAPLALPCILGWDLAGIVEQAADCPGWSTGESVFAMADMTRNGAYAQYIAIRAEYVARVPATLTLRQAAAVPLAALTAWQALFDLGDLKPRQLVLVHAAAGGVGQFAVQLAHQAGARVVGTASSANAALVRSLGADEVIDYNHGDFRLRVRDVDLVIDGVGGDTRARSWDVLHRAGRLVAVAMPLADEQKASTRGVRCFTVRVMPDGERLAKIASMLDAGQLRVVIDREFPLWQVADAHERSECRHACGKIILRV